MKLDLLKTKAKRGLAGLTLACTTMAPCAMAQNQSDKNDNTDTHVMATLENDTISANKSTYLGFGVQNIIGVQTTGKKIDVLDRATLGLNTGFQKNKWHGDASVQGTFELRNRDVAARLTQATASFGRKIFRESDIGITAGREYTENDIFDGKTRFIDYGVADFYRDFYGNLSDRFTAFYKHDKGLQIEMGVIENADSTFYLVPNFRNVDFFGKVSFAAKTKQQIAINGSVATELGDHKKKIMGDLGVNGSNFGVVLSGQYDMGDNYFGLCVAGNYISKRDFRYILSLAKQYYIYKIQAGVEKKNVMFFVTVDAAKNYSAFNAGLSWMLDYKHNVR